MNKLEKNLGGYCGELIDIRVLLEQIKSTAASRGWTKEVFYSEDGLDLMALHRKSHAPRRKIYISAGIHGDEPAGPSAILRLIKESSWPSDTEIFMCPCLNPIGFLHNKRENPQGLDLNRQYKDTEAREVQAHKEWLSRQPAFDVCLCLHEDWESKGFYLYQLNPHGGISHAEQMIQEVSKVCPIDLSTEIEGRPAVGGIIQPIADPKERPLWPEAIYLIAHKTRQNYTLEAPSDFELPVRVNALVSAVRAVLDAQVY